jgi:hypothetical protein
MRELPETEEEKREATLHYQSAGGNSSTSAACTALRKLLRESLSQCFE